MHIHTDSVADKCKELLSDSLWKLGDKTLSGANYFSLTGTGKH